jgi:EAL and modified HD-GYP domain-containing signal transduction protein
VPSRSLLTQRLVYMRLLAALNKPDVGVREIEELVKQDAALSHLVLRMANSAGFAQYTEVRSIGHAITLTGLDQIRKWASVWVVGGVNGGNPPELAITALLRARLCESVCNSLSSGHGSESFLLGLCSLLDAMLGQPMETAIADLPLRAPMRDALLGRQNSVRAILDGVIAYERGAWEQALGALCESGLSFACLGEAYRDALRWVKQASQPLASAA